MTKRERTIAIFVGVAVGAFALDQIVVTPQLEKRKLLEGQIQTASQDLSLAKGTIQNKPVYERKLKENISKGLLADQYAAANQLQNKLSQWAGEEQLTPGPIRIGQVALPVNKIGGKPGQKEEGFMKLDCNFSVTGNTRQVANFISRIQNADIPIRISNLTIAAKQKGLDDPLELSLTVTTIFQKTDNKSEPTALAGGGSSTSRPSATSAPATLRETRP